jgi:large subunit ribosomal protein L6
MSRIGRMPITIPAGVEVTLDGQHVLVKGPLGTLERDVHPEMTLVQEDGVLRVERPSDAPRHRALHGLTRSLVANMVTGVTSGFTKVLEISGVGYRAQLQGETLVLALGFSHPVEVAPPPGISFVVETPTRLTVSGPDRELVGQVAAAIRARRKPEPYKGKGIRYAGEQIRRKAGKAGKVGGAA